jgi:cysteine desulfurase/selenocysteine lyase
MPPVALHASPPGAGFNPETLRADFPLLAENGSGQALHYLDNAASAQKPAAVIDAVSACYRRGYAPVHRGLYRLAEEATSAYEDARRRVARFVGAPAPEQLIFTRSATEAINLVATGWLQPRLRPGDRVWVSRMEHHANFLPWQRACQRAGARLGIIELTPEGELDLDAADSLFDARTRLIALTQVSNVLGTINPVEVVVREAHAARIPVLVDAAQSVAHGPVSVSALDCDFFAFSAHKMYGPTGIGALVARAERLDEMDPLLVGGGMVDRVSDEASSWAPWPARFEAGSPHLAGALGFAAATDYLRHVGMDAVATHLSQLTHRALSSLADVPALRLYGPQKTGARAGIVSFTLEGIHPHDLAQLCAERCVAIRAGNHCCQPLMAHLGVNGTARASFALYNTPADIDALCHAIQLARHILL